MYDELKKLRVLTDALINAEELLNESTSRWEYALNAMPNLVFVTDVNMTIKFVNQAMCDAFQKESKDFINNCCFNLVASRKSKAQCHCARFPIEEIVSLEDIFIPDSGRWYNHTKSPIYEEGVLIGYICVLTDVTERKLSEDALIKSEAFYKNLFERMGDGVAVYEPIDNGDDFVFRDINPSGESIGRLSKNQHLGRKITDVYPNVKYTGIFDALQQVYKTGESQEVPLIYYKDDRVSHWVSNYIFKLPSGELVAVYRDVTKEKNAVDDLAAREKMLRAIYRSTPAGIGVTTTNRDILWVNEKVAKMLGYKKEDLEGQNARILYPDEGTYLKAGKDKYEQISKSGKGTVETKWIKKDGTILDILLSSTKMDGDDRVAFAAQDITHLKNTERALLKDEDRLESLLKLSQLSNVEEKELVSQALEACVELTDSEIGYFHFYNQDEITLGLFTWSKKTLEVCKAAKDLHYPLSSAGIWADCIREHKPVVHNDYNAVENKGGLPEGHAVLKRHMSIPVFDNNGNIVGVVGVGNKKEPYDDADVRQLQLFMENLWKTVTANRASRELERLVLALKKECAQK